MKFFNQRFDLPILCIFCFFGELPGWFSFDLLFKQASGLPVGFWLCRLPLLVDGWSSIKICMIWGNSSTNTSLPVGAFGRKSGSWRLRRKTSWKSPGRSNISSTDGDLDSTCSMTSIGSSISIELELELDFLELDFLDPWELELLYPWGLDWLEPKLWFNKHLLMWHSICKGGG